MCVCVWYECSLNIIHIWYGEKCVCLSIWSKELFWSLHLVICYLKPVDRPTECVYVFARVQVFV